MGAWWSVEDGGVWHRVTRKGADGQVIEIGRRLICAEGSEMALAYDAVEGSVQKIGPRQAVESWTDALNAAFAQAFGTAGLARGRSVEMVTFRATRDAVAAAMACWERTGSCRDFAARFGQAAGPAPSPRH